MYHKIKHFKRLGFSNAKIARELVLDPRTVKKWDFLSEAEFERFLTTRKVRRKILDEYEGFVKDKLMAFPDTSTAQIHDWLKEYHSNFPEIAPRTVYNFVMHIRQKHNIPIADQERQFAPVEDLPYGQQAQVDFGSYNMRSVDNGRKKIHFFAMVLSRSRMKYTLFQDKPFTAKTTPQAHEKAFKFFDGIPHTMVYDQDRVMMVSENMGDHILTSAFKKYAQSRGIKLHFCRKADPQSKGKVENVIQYIKKNFLKNRCYHDLELLNEEALKWLKRTANHLEHNYTKKSPQKEFEIEKPELKPYVPISIENVEMKPYNVRKTNNINYKSNFYSLPIGIYQGRDTYVSVLENKGNLEIYDPKGSLLCKHEVSLLKGQTIINNNHKRDNSKSISELMDQVKASFPQEKEASVFLEAIKAKWPRYVRDQLQSVIKTLEEMDAVTAHEALKLCLENNIESATEFKEVAASLCKKQINIPTKAIKLLNSNILAKTDFIPEKSNMNIYETIVNH